jgi:hypothetical protein
MKADYLRKKSLETVVRTAGGKINEDQLITQMLMSIKRQNKTRHTPSSSLNTYILSTILRQI